MAGQSHATDTHGSDPAGLTERRANAPEMSEDEAAELYANQWIFMEVTRTDEHGVAIGGRILDHHPKRDGIQDTIMELVTEVKAAGTGPAGVRGYSVFYGVRLFRTAAEWEEHKRQTGWPRGGRGGD